MVYTNANEKFCIMECYTVGILLTRCERAASSVLLSHGTLDQQSRRGADTDSTKLK